VAARRLEIFLDLIGCLSTPPTGYLLDPAYRGLLNEEERRLSEALAAMADDVPEGPDSPTAAQEVAALLRRLGHGSPPGEDAAPIAAPDGSDRIVATPGHPIG
jgi:hypothetical protein